MSRRGWWLFGGAAAGFVVIFAATVVITARPALFSDAGSASQCRAASRVAAAVEPFATGHMAAFGTVEPADLADLPYDGRGKSARTIADLSGRVILLNLWATWCAPCRAEMPMLADLHEALSGEDFAVIATSIDSDDDNRPEDFLQETDATALAYHREPSLRLFNSLREAGLAKGMPTTLLIAPDGCVAGVLHGIAEWDSPDAKRLVRAALEAA